jgi:hypothetical protein
MIIYNMIEKKNTIILFAKSKLMKRDKNKE